MMAVVFAEQVLQGQQERVTIEVDGQPHRVIFSDENQWRSLLDSLPVGKVRRCCCECS